MKIKNQILREFPNHFFEDGVLYRGEITRTIVKPDLNGLYRIRYQREWYIRDLDSLLLDPEEEFEKRMREHRAKKAKYIKDANRTINSICKKHRMQMNTYTKWLMRTYNKTKEEFSIDEHEELIKERKAIMANKISIPKLCEQYNIVYVSFKSYLYKMQISLAGLTENRVISHMTDFIEQKKVR